MLRDDGLLSLNCGVVEEGFLTPRTPFRMTELGSAARLGLRRVKGGSPINRGKRTSGRTPERRRATATQGKRRADPRSGSSRNGENQNRYVVVPMATAECGRGVKDCFLQFFSGGRAVLLEKAEQPRLSELLALGTGRLRHPVGE